jgi:hypothetical protein
MVSVHRKNEISLFGTFFKIVGPVEPVLASQFAQKQVIGDYTKESELIASSWITSDQREGIGIKDMEEVRDANRAWFSTAWLNTKGHRTLPRLVTATTNPTGSDPLILIEFNNVMYCAFGTAVYTWTEGTSTWTTASHTLPANPTDAIVYKNKLYFCWMPRGRSTIRLTRASPGWRTLSLPCPTIPSPPCLRSLMRHASP